MLSPPSRSRSPIKTVTSTRSTTYHDDKEDGTKEQSQETYNREVTEKKTTIVDFSFFLFLEELIIPKIAFEIY